MAEEHRVAAVSAAAAAAVPLRRYEIALSRVLLLLPSSQHLSNNKSTSSTSSSSSSTPTTSSCRTPRGVVVQPVFRVLLPPPCPTAEQRRPPPAPPAQPPRPPRLELEDPPLDVNDFGILNRDTSEWEGGSSGAARAATPDSGPGHSQDLAKAEAKRRQVESMLHCLNHVLQQRSHRHEGKSGGGEEEGDSATISMNSTRLRHRHNRSSRRRHRLTVVDLGGGSGHLAIEAAMQFHGSRIDVVVVDLNRHSLDLMKIKAKAEAARTQRRSCHADEGDEHADDHDDDFLASHPAIPLERTEIPNLYALCGPIERYLFVSRPTDPSVDGSDTDTVRPRQDVHVLPFDVGLALHLCGQSTDVAIRACLSQQAALVAAPCCVGKTQTTRKNPYVWQATGSNTSSIQYPQSDLYRQLLLWPHSSSGSGGEDDGTSENDNDPTSPAPNPSSALLLWDALASAADDSSHSTNATDGCCRRAAKVLVEWDRCLFLQQHGYHTILTRMVPPTASPKHDILVAVPKSWTRQEGDPGASLQFQDVDHEAVLELEQTRRYLQAATSATAGGCVPCLDITKASPSSSGREAVAPTHGVWSESEVVEVRELLAARFRRDGGRAPSKLEAPSSEEAPWTTDRDDVYYFPTGMGRDRRKLIHYVASSLGLEHWSHGKKQGTGKTVAVALAGTRRRLRCRDVSAGASSK